MSRPRVLAAVLLDAGDILVRWGKRLRRHARRLSPPKPDVNDHLLHALKILAARPSASAVTDEQGPTEAPVEAAPTVCPCGAPVVTEQDYCHVHLQSLSAAWLIPRTQN